MPNDKYLVYDNTDLSSENKKLNKLMAGISIL
jgi:hypothetical protein